MTTQSIKKLALNRETLLTMSTGDLDDVHSGVTPATIIPFTVRSLQICGPIVAGATVYVEKAAHRLTFNPCVPPAHHNGSANTHAGCVSRVGVPRKR